MVREEFDLALWFLAQDGEKTDGALLCRVREAERGWINQVAVLRPWRKRGLGTALLWQAFDTFYRRGITRVGLVVNSVNVRRFLR